MMKYTTLQEYFYKLQNVLYLIILIPLLAFVYLIVFSPEKPEIGKEQFLLINSCLLGVVGMEWLLATIIFHRKMKTIRKQPGLGIKLENYFTVTVIRFGFYASACLVLAVGYFLTSDSILTATFGVGLVLFFALWPRPSKVCRDLKLKGDEKTMVLHRKMTL